MYIEHKDIIITDPCYIIKPNSDDWDNCNYGDMDVLGINNYLCSDTLYGDWSCTTFEKETNKVLGRFCADAGMVAVFVLDEVLKYNPEFDYHLTAPHTTTLIKDFTGNVEIKRVTISGVYTAEDTYEINGEIHCKEGEKWEEDEIQVHGTGSVNFYTTQTGL